MTFSEICRFLIREYHMSFEQIAELTDYQISFLTKPDKERG